MSAREKIPGPSSYPPSPPMREIQPIGKRDAEIESIRRTLYNVIDKLNRLQRQDAELKTT